MRVALCQVNPTVGDIDGNAAMIVEWTRQAAAAGADLAVFPELVLAGYPAEDLVLKPHFVARCDQALARIAPELEIPTLVGLPHRQHGVLHNSAALVVDGSIIGIYAKRKLPNYAVFDEARWFTPGPEPLVFEVPTRDGVPARVGVTICEDVWVDGPAAETAELGGVDLIVNLSASPWRMDREDDRELIVERQARTAGTWLLLCNQVGGQDELVFDGHSVAADGDGVLRARARGFGEELLVVDTDETLHPLARDGRPVEEDVWNALQLGLRDYVRKNGFRSVVLGLSGGIDSALVLALAVDSLGADHVHAVTMPSRYSSGATRGDAHTQADALGVPLLELPIEPVVGSFTDALAEQFAATEPDVTEENLQARVRGTLLMALSNKFGHLVLATGNKSEYAVGYATLYGDMNGGFAPLKDVPKTLVYRLARWRNELARAVGGVDAIPVSVIDRPPTAELRDDQRDSDSLPDYDTLDALLELLVDRDASIDEAVAAGFDSPLVVRVQSMLDRAEYKRRQAPPGVRVTSKAFGRDRRMPITNRFDGRGPQNVLQQPVALDR